jgi:hypothetical protein
MNVTVNSFLYVIYLTASPSTDLSLCLFSPIRPPLQKLIPNKERARLCVQMAPNTIMPKGTGYHPPIFCHSEDAFHRIDSKHHIAIVSNIAERSIIKHVSSRERCYFTGHLPRSPEVSLIRIKPEGCCSLFFADHFDIKMLGSCTHR